MREAFISIRGMSCAACAGSITDALEACPTVQKAGVSLLTNEAKVKFSEPMNAEDLVSIIEDCGFEALLVAVSPSQEKLLASASTILDITGMTCGACSSSITEALENMAGVEQASVSLITNLAKILHDASLPVESMISTIEDCGFDATLASSSQVHSSNSGLEETKLEVLGMTCGACSASITEALQKLPGVVDASVSQITSAAHVTHKSGLKPEAIKETIEDCGFDARVLLSQPLAGLPPTEDQKDDFVLQIHGIDKDTDISALQYNAEAVLSSLAGVELFQFVFKGEVTPEDFHNDVTDLGQENLTDELRISLYSNGTGIRHLLDSLNTLDSRILFIISNSVDQSLSSQLKILSKTKDIEYWRSNFCYSLAAGAPIVALSVTENTGFWKKLTFFHGLYLVSLIELAIATYILFHLGAVFFKNFKVFIRHKGKHANMDVLVCISTLVSYLFSVLSMFLSVWSGQMEKPPKVLFETVAMLVCFVSFGKWIENRAKGSTSSALSKLMSLTPTTCTIIDDEAQLEHITKMSQDDKTYVAAEVSARTIPIDLIQKNDIAVVYAGGKIPADGKIVYGSTDVDESIITGESLPVQKKVGDTVIGGSINGPFLIYIQVTGAGKNSQLHQIINIVKESQVNKAPVQRFADFVAARFVAFVLCLSFTTLLFWMLYLKFYPEYLPSVFIKDENGKYFVCLNLAISVIVVACPCALGLAAPTAVMVGTGVGASFGALIKGGDVLEKSSGVNVILFDKTGTLTQGDLQITKSKQILGTTGLSETQWWTLVGSVETHSEHPTGKAISAQAKEILSLSLEKDSLLATIEDFQVYTGMGVKARVTLSGKSFDIAVGNKRMVVKDYPSAREDLSRILLTDLKDSISSISHVIIDGSYSGYFELSDTIKPCARVLIDYLQHVENYQVGIVTGDNKEVAHKIGAELGVPKGNIFSEVSPLDKDKVVTQLRNRFGGRGNISIAFVGDGINDAPALVQADIGMAISTGTDIAIDSAEVVLMGSQGKKNDLFGVVTALQISQASFKKIKWNFFGATIYNFLMLPFAMGCFLKYGWMLSPVSGAGAMACSSISVVLNSLLLKKWKPPRVKEIVENLYLNEESIGSEFSLKSSTLGEFNAVKRGGIRNKVQFHGWSRVFSSIKRKAHGEADYEMVESPQN
ncbi:copper-transporting ATPase [Metschnikowia bicuspidata var. bicuspidata NRRL YB-4993]|uniref:P-type Cu(+) transporter n=1 Tax=Metschnikowia bicuspidata var. bicuspidata NRRL YB-4993 TaxID=869754 RepID=A0A1A0H9E1_9ASCO|nr:copper-transporting ATPase [Metschnikowia bicuspidata var. bicuspidata NRRL YB-4993]OBA20493.1 copper-transporting ATPase [Metschnikowia bicuspidata var. bicuspidata NRRL YB-4993]